MKPFWNLVRMDLMKLVYSPMELVFPISIPILVVAVIGLFFGGHGGGGGGKPSLTVCLIDHDESVLSNFLQSMDKQEPDSNPLHIVTTDMDTALEMMEDGKASATVVLPEGLLKSLLKQEPCTIQVIKNPRHTLMPQVVEHGMQMICDILTTLSYVLQEPLNTIDGFQERGEEPSELEIVDSARQWYRATKVFSKVADPLVLWTDELDEDDETTDANAVIETTTETETEETTDDNGGNHQFGIFDYLLPSVGLFGLLFGVSASVQDILKKQRDGRMQRLAVSPISKRELFIASITGAVGVGLSIQLVVILVGIFLFDVTWGNWLGVALISILGTISITGILAAVAGFCRSEQQYGMMGTLVIMAMCMVGGSMVPLEALPQSLHIFSKFTINYWMIQGFRGLQSGGGIMDIVGPLIALAAISAVAILLGSQLLSRRLERGEVMES